ncbi:hypothetical protein FB461_1953 [Rarobacter faecitabidus]|uniref:Uncharacterized protein n=1 Tax=Rarobacter faecitabidus TaxID=13243 RepID=A0A542ZDY7_RARFA|nr:hypothetical protein FB461_1953 [Rarobacter faecitabidus]
MHSLITTVLDLLGAVLIVIALALAAGAWWTPAGVFVAGVGLVAVSWLVDLPRRRSARKRARR